MRVAVTGATGVIGSALVRALEERGDEPVVLSRNGERARAQLGVEAFEWRAPKAEPPPLEALRASDAVVNLVGETLAQRWTDEKKREFRDSRVLTTRNLVAALAELPEAERPRVLINQSATGWYGARGEERLDEAEPAGDDFAAQLTLEAEAEADKAEKLGVRVVLTRTGIVLEGSSGALKKMLPFFKLGVGGPVAGGRQYLPWIHLDDVVGAFLFALDNDALRGPVNVTAPEPVTNKEFSRTLGRVLKRPAIAPVPALALKVLYGEMATIVLTGQRAVPARLQEAGYRFSQPDLEQALRDAI